MSLISQGETVSISFVQDPIVHVYLMLWPTSLMSVTAMTSRAKLQCAKAARDLAGAARRHSLCQREHLSPPKTSAIESEARGKGSVYL